MHQRWVDLKLWQKVLRFIGVLVGAFVVWAIARAVVQAKGGPTTPTASGSDIVVAIVGGVLLAVALNRPRVTWRSGLGDMGVRWRELGLSVFAFFSGGYAFAALYDILKGHLPPTTIHLLLPAAVLMFVYLLVIHHEPFVYEGHVRGWCYCGVATGAAFVGFALADVASGRADSSDTWGVIVGAVIFLLSVGWFARLGKGLRAPTPTPDTTRGPAS